MTAAMTAIPSARNSTMRDLIVRTLVSPSSAVAHLVAQAWAGRLPAFPIGEPPA
jgi:hypothetical protein